MNTQSPRDDRIERLTQSGQSGVLRFITCGSVDDGKSTLIGRLLYDSKLLFDDQIHSLEHDSRKHGTTGEDMDFAISTDSQRIIFENSSDFARELTLVRLPGGDNVPLNFELIDHPDMGIAFSPSIVLRDHVSRARCDRVPGRCSRAAVRRRRPHPS